MIADVVLQMRYCTADGRKRNRELGNRTCMALVGAEASLPQSWAGLQAEKCMGHLWDRWWTKVGHFVDIFATDWGKQWAFWGWGADFGSGLP
jgi:hypothetical protein